MADLENILLWKNCKLTGAQSLIYLWKFLSYKNGKMSFKKTNKKSGKFVINRFRLIRFCYNLEKSNCRGLTFSVNTFKGIFKCDIILRF